MRLKCNALLSVVATVCSRSWRVLIIAIRWVLYTET